MSILIILGLTGHLVDFSLIFWSFWPKMVKMVKIKLMATVAATTYRSVYFHKTSYMVIFRPLDSLGPGKNKAKSAKMLIGNGIDFGSFKEFS